MLRRIPIAPAAALVAVALLAASSSWAQPPRDHLQCFKIKDTAAKTAYTLDLSPDNAVFPRLEPGCTLSLPARQLCVDVSTRNVDPAPPGGVTGQGGQAYLCYKARCNRLETAMEVTDQFGVHDLEIGQTTTICAPIVGPCTNGVWDGDESDVDCGGSCSACANGANCIVDTDCASGRCGPDGVCISYCDPGFADCDGLPENGCEANLLEDPNNCGGCGITVWTGNQCAEEYCADGDAQWYPLEAGTPCDQNGGMYCDGAGNCIAGCLDGMFTCGTGECIEEWMTCNGVMDCPDGSDEAPLNPFCSSGCLPYQFTCGDGSCIDETWQCDGYADCPDGSDEAPVNPICPGGCQPGQFECRDGRCIDEAWQCNGIGDCPDGEDEAPLNPLCTGVCLPGQFECGDGTCIDEGWQCNFVADCPDGTDEAPFNPICPGVCPPGQFTCGDGTCIDQAWECDGIIDCPDGSDEVPIDLNCYLP